MPIALDPKHRARFVLESDRDKPKDKQPAFFFRGMSIRQSKAFGAEVDKATDGRSGEEAIAEASRLIRTVLVGWENMIDPQTKKKIAYDPKKLEEILTFDELWELAVGAISPRAIQAIDLKNLESQSPSSSAGSAKAAGTKKAGGSAGTG